MVYLCYCKLDNALIGIWKNYSTINFIPLLAVIAKPMAFQLSWFCDVLGMGCGALEIKARGKAVELNFVHESETFEKNCL